MKPTEILLLNLEEVRRRSLKVWQGIPPQHLHWKPDAEAMTCIELVRHVPECEYLYLYMLKNGDRFPYDQSPWAARPYAGIEAEIEFAEPYHKELLDLVGSYTQEELSATKILWSSKGYARTIADFILRVAYHESVHTGQILSYLRMLRVPRPDVWD